MHARSLVQMAGCRPARVAVPNEVPTSSTLVGVSVTSQPTCVCDDAGEKYAAAARAWGVEAAHAGMLLPNATAAGESNKRAVDKSIT